MNILNRINSMFTKPLEVKTEKDRSGSTINSLFVISNFDGEKTPGEIGIPTVYRADFPTLRVRAWQSYYESEITQTILGKYVLWAVGSGLKLQCEPMVDVLKSEGVNLNVEAFSKQVESYFKLWAKSKTSSYSGNQSFNKLSSETFFNGKTSGDVLVVLRYDGKNVTVQNIDGGSIVTPYNINRDWLVRDGVRTDKKGKHIEYYVANVDGGYDTIKAFDSKGRRVAFMYYGSQYRINDVRGMPKISASLETIKKLDRYKEATVGSAEERQNIPFQITHQSYSEGDNPLLKSAVGSVTGKVPNTATSYEESKGLVGLVKQTQNKEAYNMPVGSKMESIESKSELYFKEFYDTLFDHICGVFHIPPDVAKSMYNGSYSASRAAIKDWEYTLKTERNDFTEQALSYIFAFWLDVMVLEGKIKAPGYIEALNNNNTFLLDAYRSCRFVGANVPHIDPVKEVKAEREKLGPLGANTPLTTPSSSMERLDGGDFDNVSSTFNIETSGYSTDKPQES